jgi:hypothetical protein
MKELFICLTILTCINFNVCAQKITQQNSWLKCECCSIRDSLNKTNYFHKAKQVDPGKIPQYVDISLFKMHGDLGIEVEIFELVFSDNVGYLAYYASVYSGLNTNYYSYDFKPRARLYTVLTNINFVSDVLQTLNQFYVYDSSLFIRNPHPTYSTGQGGSILKIDIKFSQSEEVSNTLNFSGDRYCLRDFELNEYLRKLCNYNTNPNSLGVSEANYLLKKYHSQIAFYYLDGLYNSSPYLKTIEITTLSPNYFYDAKINPLKISN